MAGQATASPEPGIQSLILHGVDHWGNVQPYPLPIQKFGSNLCRYLQFDILPFMATACKLLPAAFEC
jgi:hypothetical protein